MSTFHTVLLALGLGDRVKGARLAPLAILASLPVWLALCVLLAIGPGR